MPRLLGYLLMMAAGYAALLAGAYFALQYALEPLYVFTEWVPAVLVEYSEISKTLWALWQGAAHLMTLQTPEVARLRHFASLMQTGCMALGFALCYAWGRLNAK